MTRRVLMVDVNGGQVQDKLRLGWTDSMKVALGSRVMMVEAQNIA